MMARIGRIGVAVAIYCIWLERNQRIFSSRNCSVDIVIRNIEEYVRAKAWNWKYLGLIVIGCYVRIGV